MRQTYDHYIAVDWSSRNMAIARMTGKTNKISVVDVASEVGELKVYLRNLRGSKVLTLEETTTSQWLYTELKGEVDRLVICDPVRNHLLSEGAKTDKIDASKRVQLLKSDLLKEVYHSLEEFLGLRRWVSGYEDVVRAGVRLKNQRYSLFRACGKSGYEKSETQSVGSVEQKVMAGIERQIECNGKEKAEYEGEFKSLARAAAGSRPCDSKSLIRPSRVFSSKTHLPSVNHPMGHTQLDRQLGRRLPPRHVILHRLSLDFVTEVTSWLSHIADSFPPSYRASEVSRPLLFS